MEWERDDGEFLNAFLNFNGGGDCDVTKGQGDAPHAVKRWHRDIVTEGTTHRMLMYYMQKGRRGCLRVRIKGKAYEEIWCPPGCALLVDVRLLEQYEHAHGIEGQCISIVCVCNALAPPRPCVLRAPC